CGLPTSIRLQWNPELRSLREGKILRHDTDDSYILSVHLQRSADHSRICVKRVIPKLIRDHGYPQRPMVLRKEGAAQQWENLSRSEELIRNCSALNYSALDIDMLGGFSRPNLEVLGTITSCGRIRLRTCPPAPCESQAGKIQPRE